jgi:hypothetical protein
MESKGDFGCGAPSLDQAFPQVGICQVLHGRRAQDLKRYLLDLLDTGLISSHSNNTGLLQMMRTERVPTRTIRYC